MGQARIRSTNGTTPRQPMALPIFNSQQLTSEALQREKSESRYLECFHIKESRQDPDSDLLGYFEKYEVTKDGKVVACVFIKVCEACAVCGACAESTDIVGEDGGYLYALVARVRYQMLSERTMKAMYKNQGDKRIEPVSDYAKHLAAEAAAEGPDTIN